MSKRCACRVWSCRCLTMRRSPPLHALVRSCESLGAPAQHQAGPSPACGPPACGPSSPRERARRPGGTCVPGGQPRRRPRRSCRARGGAPEPRAGLSPAGLRWMAALPPDATDALFWPLLAPDGGGGAELQHMDDLEARESRACRYALPRLRLRLRRHRAGFLWRWSATQSWSSTDRWKRRCWCEALKEYYLLRAGDRRRCGSRGTRRAGAPVWTRAAGAFGAPSCAESGAAHARSDPSARACASRAALRPLTSRACAQAPTHHDDVTLGHHEALGTTPGAARAARLAFPTAIGRGAARHVGGGRLASPGALLASGCECAVLRRTSSRAVSERPTAAPRSATSRRGAQAAAAVDAGAARHVRRGGAAAGRP